LNNELLHLFLLNAIFGSEKHKGQQCIKLHDLEKIDNSISYLAPQMLFLWTHLILICMHKCKCNI